jgi:UDPglucose 6-dehydrogenase
MTEKLGVVGLGKLGLPLAAVLAKHFTVHGVDVDERRLQQIQGPTQPFFEPSLNEYLRDYGYNLTVSSDYSNLKDCETVFVMTQTPSLPSGHFDLWYVENAVKRVHDVNPDGLIAVGSTLNIGDTDKLATIHERIAYSPEFIKQGSIIHDFENPKFVLVGSYTSSDAKQLAHIWKTVHDKPVYAVSPVEAEIIKLALNVSFTLGITFANTIGELCQKFGANPLKVLGAVYRDRRNFTPGLGFGGPCFPRDVECFKATCNTNRVRSGFELANLLGNLNAYVVDKAVRQLHAYGTKVGFLGVSYKPNVPYIYASQPLMIASTMLNIGSEVHVYDPLAEDSARQLLPEAHFCASLEECIRHADVLFVGTANYSNVETDKPVVNPWR